MRRARKKMYVEVEAKRPYLRNAHIHKFLAKSKFHRLAKNGNAVAS